MLNLFNSVLFVLLFILTGSLDPALAQIKKVANPLLKIGTPGGEFTVPIFVRPTTLNPIIAVLDELDILLHASLLELNPITGVLELGLASGYEVSSDNRTVTFFLREGLRWSDGHPFTVKDVVFTYQDLVFNPNVPAVNREFFRTNGQFPEFKVIDGQTVSFTFSKPIWSLLRVIEIQMVLPQHALQELLASPAGFLKAWSLETPSEKIVGMGPFQLVEYVPNKRVLLRRNKFYWKTDPSGQHLPYLDQITARITNHADTTQEFLSNRIDYVSLSSPKQKFQLSKFTPPFTFVHAGAETLFNFLAFNMDVNDEELRAIFRSPLFRQAISLVIDRKQITQEAYGGFGVERFNPVHPDSPFVIKVSKFPFDLEQARTKLKQLGLVDMDRDGLINLKDGSPFRFTLLTNVDNTVQQAIAQQLSKDMGRLGIEVEIEAVPFKELNERIRERGPLFSLFGPSFEAVLTSFVGTIDPGPLGLLYGIEGPDQFYHFSAVDEPFDYEQRIDTIFHKAKMTFDNQRRQTLFAEFQKIVSEQLPVIPIASAEFTVATRRSIGNIEAVKAVGGDGPIDLIDVLFIR